MSEWMWAPGEFEYKYATDFNMGRTKRGHLAMLLWKPDVITSYVKFFKKFVITKTERFRVYADGEVTVEANGRGRYVACEGGVYVLKPGEYVLSVYVYAKPSKIACVYIEGKQIISGKDWKCTFQDGIIRDVECGGFFRRTQSPNRYRLPVRKRSYVSVRDRDGYRIYDMGMDVFGFCCFVETSAKGSVDIYFGESEEEAKDFAFCELIDRVEFCSENVKTRTAKAFRYVCVKCNGEATYKDFYVKEEYRPQPRCVKAKFSDELLQKIWDVSIDTLQLCTREFFIDGIKRDRWIWSGDATQAYLMNWYSFFDEETVNRTQVALGGKGKITQHINTIIDYTLYWMISIYDTYFYTGNLEFLRMWYGRFLEIAEYVISCCDSRYRLQKKSQDWLFIDWGKGIHTKDDSYSFLQILLCKAMRCASKVSDLVEDSQRSTFFADVADSVYRDLQQNFYSKEAGAFIYGIKDEQQDSLVLRQPNIMAIFYEIATQEQANTILHSVLLNDSIPALETPYMRYYENSAYCILGQEERVVSEIKSYWGGMLALGATTFWELYRPEDQGVQHYGMYGAKYGKSLCHAWGASPIWLISRYVIGLSPANAGYSSYLLRPAQVDIGDFDVDYPAGNGRIRIRKQKNMWSVYSQELDGVIELCDKTVFVKKGGVVFFEA